jgi:hypothetical protein
MENLIRKVCLTFVVATIGLSQAAFADDQDMSGSKPCATIAKACLDAGYTRDENASKKFWHDCMKPVVLGKTVDGVTVDAATVKACRTDKITEMKKELKEFQNK